MVPSVIESTTIAPVPANTRTNVPRNSLASNDFFKSISGWPSARISARQYAYILLRALRRIEYDMRLAKRMIATFSKHRFRMRPPLLRMTILLSDEFGLAMSPYAQPS